MKTAEIPWLLALMVTAAAPPWKALARRGSPPSPASQKPAEESRLNPIVFRKGLQKRGLTEILQLHLRDFPPARPTTRKLLLRDAKLAEFADMKRSRKERAAAIAQANRLLEEIIRDKPNDPRRFAWRYTLAHSLLYDEAEPFFTNILYRGGNDGDRKSLLARTTRAVNLLREVQTELAAEYERIDELSIPAFERLERNGYIEKIDELQPKADYLLLWALFYDSLPRPPDDPTRLDELNQVLTFLQDRKTLLDTPHKQSGVQVQALLLAGMIHRRLNHHSAARKNLNQALRVEGQLSDAEQRDRVQWAATLARLERVRNDRDDGRYQAALTNVTNLVQQVPAHEGDHFGLQIVAALTQRSVYRAQASALEKEGKTTSAKRLRVRAWHVLTQLAAHHPHRRDEIYAAVYDTIGPQADPAGLDPFEQSALMAGLLYDASRSPERADALLDRAINTGKRFLARTDAESVQLVPEILYNLAVARYRRGLLAQAAEDFLHIATQHPDSPQALQAATLAVQLSADLYADPALRPRPDLQQLYCDSLKTLITHYSQSDVGRYWRFYYAQLLEERGENDNAAAQYALVDADHELYTESRFRRLRCLARSLDAASAAPPVDLLAIRKRAAEFFKLVRDFITQTTSERSRRAGSQDAEQLRSFVARAKLITAEVQVLPSIDRAARALETLEGFEKNYPKETSISGRVWRVRLVAYERRGRLDEAARAIPAYIAADPDGAGPTLQTLYESMAEEADRLLLEGDNEKAQKKAEVALMLAQQITRWAKEHDAEDTSIDQRERDIQLAQANLRAKRYPRARELFEPYAATALDSTKPDAADLQVALGYAESLYALGQTQDALSRFNRLATHLPPDDPIRWKVLLRDLQCRTSLGQTPQDIIQVIDQQKYLHPGLGGPSLAARFEKLQRENQRRLDRKK